MMLTKNMKAVFISSMLPSGHFSQILTNAINQNKNIDLIVYTDNNPKNLEIKNCGTIKNIWPKNLKFIFEIVKNVKKDQPDVIHIQQEFNMYGGLFTAACFPILPLLLKISGFKVVTTIHASVYKKQVNKDFISLFTTKKSFLINPFTLKLFFYYTFMFTALFSNKVICHTNLLKDMLIKDWGVPSGKISVIPTGIPQKKLNNTNKENYFFYFGYMVRRKGLEYVFKGFEKFMKKNKGQYKLVMAGGIIKGQEEAFDEITKMISDYKIGKNVVIKGFVEDEALDDLYSKALAVIIPAKVSMGSSGPLYQAQSYGKCILASNIGHFKEDLNHLEDGVLVDNSQWDKAFEFVIKNPKEISRIEKNVKKKARIKSAKNIAKKHIEVYENVTNVL